MMVATTAKAMVFSIFPYRENAVERVNAMKTHMERLLFAQALRGEPTVKIEDED